MNKTALAVSLVLAVSIVASAAKKDPLAIGSKVPELKLTDEKGKKVSIFEGVKKDEIVVLGFYSPRCPYNVAFWDRLAAVSSDYKGKGVRFVGINPNKKEALSDVREAVAKAGVDGPVLRDEKLSVTDTLGAMATPHMMVIDAERVLRYRGAVDDSGGNKKDPVTHHLRLALDAVLAGKPVPEAEPDSFIGCTIKR